MFLRKLIPGSSEHSFGIHVAKMAGMPKDVLDKANDMLKHLEHSRSSKELTVNHISPQLQFFDINDPLLDEIRNCLLYTSPSPRALSTSRMRASA